MIGYYIVIRASTWNSPAIISALVTNWIEDGTLAISKENRRRDGARSQKICRQIFKDMAVISHPNASFAWLPLPNTQRAEEIVTKLNKHQIFVSAAKPFAVGNISPQAIRLAFDGMAENDLKNILKIVHDEIAISK